MLQYFQKLSERGQIETIGFIKGKLSEQIATEVTYHEKGAKLIDFQDWIKNKKVRRICIMGILSIKCRK